MTIAALGTAMKAAHDGLEATKGDKPHKKRVIESWAAAYSEFNKSRIERDIYETRTRPMNALEVEQKAIEVERARLALEREKAEYAAFVAGLTSTNAQPSLPL